MEESAAERASRPGWQRGANCYISAPLALEDESINLARGRSGRKLCDFLLNRNFPLSYERVLFLQVQPLADMPSSRVQGRDGRGWDTVGISQLAYAGGHALASSPTGFSLLSKSKVNIERKRIQTLLL